MAAKTNTSNDTELHFLPVRGRTDIARVQLLLSNISDRSLHYKLKCSAHGNISALPSSSGQIQGKSSSRVTLTLHRPSDISWDKVKKPKMLLVTTFNDIDPAQVRPDTTSTRLVALVLSEKSDRTDAPVEQLLLDAISKANSAENVEIRKADLKGGKDPWENQYNEVSPTAMLILATLFLLAFLVLYRNASSSVAVGRLKH